MDVVYPFMNAAITMPGGYSVPICRGQHWWAGDPVVKQSPTSFSTDPRQGLTSTVRPPDDPERCEAAAPVGCRCKVCKRVGASR